MKYKLSQFNYAIVNKKGCLLYNTFSGSIIRLESDEYENLLRLNVDDAKIANLINLGFIVDDRVDESSKINLLLAKSTFNDNIASFRIYTTTDCNARCFYCFEENKVISYLSRETMSSIVLFIKRQAVNAKVINICWFGGEPLLNYEIIDYFYYLIQNDSFFQGKKMLYSIITNGSLLTQNIIEKIENSWNIRSIQITLDGTWIEHNKRKNYRDDSDFHKTIENIILLLHRKSLKVSIRINYDKQNYNDVIRLIDYLANLKSINTNFNVYAYPLFDFNVERQQNFNAEDITSADAAIKDKLLEHDLCRISIPSCRNANCFATQLNGYVIDASGDIYKCASVVGQLDQCLGNVRDKSLLITKALLSWLPWELPQKCINCNLLPICLCGCRAKYLNGQDDFCSITKYTIAYAIKKYSEKGGKNGNH